MQYEVISLESDLLQILNDRRMQSVQKQNIPNYMPLQHDQHAYAALSNSCKQFPVSQAIQISKEDLIQNNQLYLAANIASNINDNLSILNFKNNYLNQNGALNAQNQIIQRVLVKMSDVEKESKTLLDNMLGTQQPILLNGHYTHCCVKIRVLDNMKNNNEEVSLQLLVVLTKKYLMLHQININQQQSQILVQGQMLQPNYFVSHIGIANQTQAQLNTIKLFGPSNIKVDLQQQKFALSIERAHLDKRLPGFPFPSELYYLVFWGTQYPHQQIYGDDAYKEYTVQNRSDVCLFSQQILQFQCIQQTFSSSSLNSINNIFQINPKVNQASLKNMRPSNMQSLKSVQQKQSSFSSITNINDRHKPPMETIYSQSKGQSPMMSNVINNITTRNQNPAISNQNAMSNQSTPNFIGTPSNNLFSLQQNQQNQSQNQNMFQLPNKTSPSSVSFGVNNNPFLQYSNNLQQNGANQPQLNQIFDASQQLNQQQQGQMQMPPHAHQQMNIFGLIPQNLAQQLSSNDPIAKQPNGPPFFYQPAQDNNINIFDIKQTNNNNNGIALDGKMEIEEQKQPANKPPPSTGSKLIFPASPFKKLRNLITTPQAIYPADYQKLNDIYKSVDPQAFQDLNCNSHPLKPEMLSQQAKQILCKLQEIFLQDPPCQPEQSMQQNSLQQANMAPKMPGYYGDLFNDAKLSDLQIQFTYDHNQNDGLKNECQQSASILRGHKTILCQTSPLIKKLLSHQNIPSEITSLSLPPCIHPGIFKEYTFPFMYYKKLRASQFDNVNLDTAKEMLKQAEVLKMWWYMNYIIVYIVIPLMSNSLNIEFLQIAYEKIYPLNNNTKKQYQREYNEETNPVNWPIYKLLYNYSMQFWVNNSKEILRESKFGEQFSAVSRPLAYIMVQKALQKTKSFDHMTFLLSAIQEKGYGEHIIDLLNNINSTVDKSIRLFDKKSLELYAEVMKLSSKDAFISDTHFQCKVDPSLPPFQQLVSPGQPPVLQQHLQYSNEFCMRSNMNNQVNSNDSSDSNNFNKHDPFSKTTPPNYVMAVQVSASFKNKSVVSQCFESEQRLFGVLCEVDDDQTMGVYLFERGSKDKMDQTSKDKLDSLSNTSHDKQIQAYNMNFTTLSYKIAVFDGEQQMKACVFFYGFPHNQNVFVGQKNFCNLKDWKSSKNELVIKVWLQEQGINQAALHYLSARFHIYVSKMFGFDQYNTNVNDNANAKAKAITPTAQNNCALNIVQKENQNQKNAQQQQQLQLQQQYQNPSSALQLQNAHHNKNLRKKSIELLESKFKFMGQQQLQRSRFPQDNNNAQQQLQNQQLQNQRTEDEVQCPAQLDTSTLYDLNNFDLYYILSSDRTTIKKEQYILYLFFKKLYKVDCQEEVDLLVSTIRFRFLNVEQLLDTCRDHERLRKNSLFIEKVNQEIGVRCNSQNLMQKYESYLTKGSPKQNNNDQSQKTMKAMLNWEFTNKLLRVRAAYSNLSELNSIEKLAERDINFQNELSKWLTGRNHHETLQNKIDALQQKVQQMEQQMQGKQLVSVQAASNAILQQQLFNEQFQIENADDGGGLLNQQQYNQVQMPRIEEHKRIRLKYELEQQHNVNADNQELEDISIVIKNTEISNKPEKQRGYCNIF